MDPHDLTSARDRAPHPPVTAAASLVTGLAVLALCAEARADMRDTDDTSRFRWLGVQSDVGVPDGATFGFVARPGLSWAKLTAAYSYNVINSGFRGGICIDPVKFVVSPSLTIEAGHVFAGELNGGWFGLSRNPQVGYDYANLHLGVEVGVRDRWRLFLHGGFSRIFLRAEDLEKASDDGTRVIIERANADATVFGTVKAGFVVLL